MADINKIQVGTTTYNINLLSTTNLSVASLNVTGTITAANLNLGGGTITAGTANLSVVKCNNVSCAYVEASTGYFGKDRIGKQLDPLIRSSVADYLDASSDPITNIALNKGGQVGFELTGVKTARLSFGTSTGDPVFYFPSNGGSIALLSDLPFDRIVKVDSSTTNFQLQVGESCVLYPITATASIGFKLTANGPIKYVAAGTVIQNTSYATSIKTGTGFARDYDVGNYYRCYYGTSTYTYSVTRQEQGIGVNTYSTPTSLFTTVSCLVCVLKRSV